MNNQTVAQVTLHNNTGNSDKIYECVVVRSGDLYLVNTQNGSSRRFDDPAHEDEGTCVARGCDENLRRCREREEGRQLLRP